MKFTLIDCRDHYSKLSIDRESFSGVISIKATKGPGPKLHSEIFTNAGTLSFQVEKVEQVVTVLLQSVPENVIQNRCVLGRLWNGFQDKVKISVEVTCANGAGILSRRIITLEGLTIEKVGESYISTGSGYTSHPSLQSSRIILTVTAEVPDEFLDLAEDTKAENSAGIPFGKKIFESGSFSDVIILAGNGAELKAHKTFLSVCSPVLAAMFQSDMKESKTGRVDMTDVSKQGVRAFLQFVYYGDLKIPKEDVEIAFELLYASHKYNVPTLEGKMFKCLMDVKDADFPVDLAFKTYMFVRNIGSSSSLDLKRKCIQIFDLKPEELKSLEKYKDLFVESPLVAMEVSQDFLTSAFPRKRKLQ